MHRKGTWTKCTDVFKNKDTRPQSEVIKILKRLQKKGLIDSIEFSPITKKFFELKKQLIELREYGFIRIRKINWQADIEVNSRIHDVKVCDTCDRRLQCMIQN